MCIDDPLATVSAIGGSESGAEDESHFAHKGAFKRGRADPTLGNLEAEINAVEPRILAPPRNGYAEQVIEFAGVAVLDRERAPADPRHVITTVVTRRAGAQDGCPGSLAGDNALRRPSDVFVLTAAEWRAPEGTALYREVVMQGIRFYLLS